MKKILVTLLTIVTVFAFSSMAFAANTTTLTTTVPDASYTLNVPANQEVPFGTVRHELGGITVTNSSGFAEGKDLKVTLNFEPFKSSTTSTTIPYAIECYDDTQYIYEDLISGNSIVFKGMDNGSAETLGRVDSGRKVVNKYKVYTASRSWGKALPGEYSSTITFAAEVVSGK